MTVEGADNSGMETVNGHNPRCRWRNIVREPRQPSCDCGLIEQAEARGREQSEREAQDAVAKLDIRTPVDGGKAYALCWQDGWRTGYDAAVAEANEGPKTTITDEFPTGLQRESERLRQINSEFPIKTVVIFRDLDPLTRGTVTGYRLSETSGEWLLVTAEGDEWSPVDVRKAARP